MALPSTGVITAAMINVELRRASNAAFNLNNAGVRTLAGRPSGTIAFSHLRGKSNIQRDPSSGFRAWSQGNYEWAHEVSFGGGNVQLRVWWAGTLVYGTSLPAATAGNMTSATVGAWTYLRGPQAGNVSGWTTYQVARQTYLV